MSTNTALSLSAAACLVLTALQAPKSTDLAGRLTAAEQEIAARKAQVDALTADVADLRAYVEKSARYAAAQAEAAAALYDTLDASEKAGFTFGINPESRHILLRGWREALDAARKDVPALPARPAAAPPSKP